MEASVGDDTGKVLCRWFNQPYLVKLLSVGEELIVHGRVEPGRQLLLIHPEMERLEPPAEATDPAHPGTEEQGEAFLDRVP